MKATINGVRYDSSKCELLGDYDHHNNGNYAGTTSLLRAANGILLIHTDSNGQNCYLNNCLREFDKQYDDTIDSFDLNDEQESRLVELGLIKLA